MEHAARLLAYYNDYFGVKYPSRGGASDIFDG
jgi:hypothetical protein